MKRNTTHKRSGSFIRAIGIIACFLAGSVRALDFGAGNIATALDLSTSSLTDTVMTVTSTSASVTNTAIIGAGQELRINGNVTVGTGVGASVALLNMNGAGSFVVNKTGGTFRIGIYPGGSSWVGAILDMSVLNTFNADLGASGTFTVSVNATAGSPFANPAPLIILATNSTITSGTLNIGMGNETSSDIMKLGSGLNVLNVNTITLATGSAGGQMFFNNNKGSVTIRGAAGGNSRSDLTLANTGSGVNSAGTTDFTGHSADLLIGNLIMGLRTGGGSGAKVNTGSFTFDTGTLDVNTVVVGNMQNASGTSGYGATGNMTLNGGQTVVNRGMIIATNASAPNAGIYYYARGTLTVGGTADVVVSNTEGTPAITLAAMAAGASATAVAIGTVNVTGGKLNLVGNLIHGADSTVGTHGIATVNLTGGALMMPNHAIVNVDNFTMTNATLTVGVYAGLPVLANRGTGTLAPGGLNAVASTIISNSYVQASTATLDIDLVSKLGYDRVTVTGGVTLAGSIYVRAPAGLAGTFDIVTSDTAITDTTVLTGASTGFTKTLVNENKTIRLFKAPPGTLVSFL